jgi:hypothetical protein
VRRGARLRRAGRTPDDDAIERFGDECGVRTRRSGHARMPRGIGHRAEVDAVAARDVVRGVGGSVVPMSGLRDAVESDAKDDGEYDHSQPMQRISRPSNHGVRKASVPSR